jgi:hypothetical protein
MSADGASFVTTILARFPRLGGILVEHLKDSAGEVLPHVFLGEVTRHVQSLLLAADGPGSPSGREARQILAYLEEVYSTGTREIRELIAVSFLENLPGSGQPGSQVREMLGPQLSAQLRRFR